MAHSRLEKIGTIFTRVTGLLRSGAMKPNDKPLWYEVYEAFPPKLEPKYDRPAPNIPIRQIFYQEDIIRAKYHKSLKFQDSINLSDTKNEYETNCQKFINIHDKLKKEGPLDDEKVFEVAKDMLSEHNSNRTRANVKQEDKEYDTKADGLLKSFTDAKSNQAVSVNVKDLFKD